MIGLLIGIAAVFVFLYWLGGVLLPEHKTIEQELIKMGDEE